MGLLPLHIFPVGALSSSVITTVWIGVFVVAFFNLRFGWELRGLVVPGYLVPLLIVQPWIGVIVLIEGIVTYYISYLLTVSLNHFRIWSNLFGRDSFLLLLILSIVVRTLFGTIILPFLGGFLSLHFQLNFDYHTNFNSYGIIVIALIANQFCRSGFKSSFVPFVVKLLVTYVIIRYGLMALTNFSMENLSYLYSNLAGSMAASPKIYIILLVAVYVTSRYSLKYAWEYNGFLLPALLALQWYEPTKIIMAFVEAMLIYGIAKIITALPYIRRVNIQGARQLLLFFNIAFVYKFILAYALIHFAPQVKITDYYAYGYLLSALVAMKMYNVDSATRVVRYFAQVLIVATIFAVIIGYAFSLLPLERFTAKPPKVSVAVKPIPHLNTKLLPYVLQQKVKWYNSRSGQLKEGDLEDVSVMSSVLKELLLCNTKINASIVAKAQTQLAKIGYHITMISDQYLYIAPVQYAVTDFGTFVINMKAANNWNLIVLKPLQQYGSAETATYLFSKLHAKLLAIYTGRELKRQTFKEYLFTKSVFKELDNKLITQPKLYVGSSPFANNKTISKLQIDIADKRFGKQLQQLIPKLQFQINAKNCSAVLQLSQVAIRKMLYKPLSADFTIHVADKLQTLNGYLYQLLITNQQMLSKQATNVYKKPSFAELMYFDKEILQPLQRVIAANKSSELEAKSYVDLMQIAANARELNYHLHYYKNQQDKKGYLILVEDPNDIKRHFWGTYVFALGKVKHYIVEVPHPLFELSTLEYGISFFSELNARALLIAGGHPYTNRDMSADVLLRDNAPSVFSLVNQFCIRTATTGILPIHIRGYGVEPGEPFPQADIVAAFYTNPVEELTQQLEKLGYSVDLAQDVAANVDFDVTPSPQVDYLRQSKYDNFAVLWLSPILRANYRRTILNENQVKQFIALGIPTSDKDLLTFLEPFLNSDHVKKLPDELVKLLDEYVATKNIIILRALQDRWRDYKFTRVIDISTQQSFLVIQEDSNLLGVVNISSAATKSTPLKCVKLTENMVYKYISYCSRWLIFER